MAMLNLLALFMLLLVGGANAQLSVTSVVVASVFSTIGAILAIGIVAYFIYRFCCRKKEQTKPLKGFDNPVSTMAYGSTDDVAEELKEVVVPDGSTQKAAIETDSRTFNKVVLLKQYNSIHSQTLPQIVHTNGSHSPEDRQATQDASAVEDGEIFTVLLNQKTPPTNGFDVTTDQDGDVMVSAVRRSGPADEKLKEGDVIDSVTVFFDDIKYEDALNILSYSAPYKVAITAMRKPEKQVETPLEAPLIAVDDSKKEEPEPRDKDDSSSNSSSSSSSDMSEDEVTELEVPKAKEEETASKSPDHGDGDKSSDGGSYHQVEVADKTMEPAEETQGSDVEDRKRSNSTSSSSSSETKKFEADEAVMLAQVGDERRSSSSSSSSSGSEKKNEEAPASETSPMVEEVVLVQSSADLDTAPEPETPKAKPEKARDDIVFVSGWRRAVKLLDLAKARLVSEETIKKLEFGEIEESEVAKDLQQYLSGEEPIAGLVFEDSGEKMSLYDATKQKIIRRGTAVSLLEAQAATGSIINPYNGSKMTVEEATREGLIDRQFEAVLVRAERAVVGYTTRLSSEPLSLFDAMKRNLVVESHGIRLLEAQIATGGIIDPKANHRLPVDVAFERGLFDKRLHDILEDPSDDTKGFFDPNTNENLTYLELMKRCIFDKDTSLRLLPFVQKKAK